jgi:hypothetical protein
MPIPNIDRVDCGCRKALIPCTGVTYAIATDVANTAITLQLEIPQGESYTTAYFSVFTDANGVATVSTMAPYLSITQSRRLTGKVDGTGEHINFLVEVRGEVVAYHCLQLMLHNISLQ